MSYLLKQLPVDSIGLNEDELRAAWKLSPGWHGAMMAAERLRNDFGLPELQFIQGLHIERHEVRSVQKMNKSID